MKKRSSRKSETGGALPSSRLQKLRKCLGPGIITGAADDDPSGIGTFAQVGAQYGYQFLWLMLFSYPLMVSVQLISARVGRVTGHGLAATLCRTMPKPLLVSLVGLLFVANAINIGADLGAMAEAVALLAGGHHLAYAVVLGLASLASQVLIPYDRYVSVLKWLTLALVAYIVVAFVVDVPWTRAIQATLIPDIPFEGKSLTVIVAVLGTTISPYLFFWQASQEVEEQRSAPGDEPLKDAPEQAARQISGVRIDTYIGMAVSNLIAFFIMLTAAVTLYDHGIRDVDSAAAAAKSLTPVAGRFGEAIFAAGIVGTGLLALPVLAGSSGYAIADTFNWRASLQDKAKKAPKFYGLIGLSMAVGIAMNFFSFNAMKALYWTAVLNGIVAIPVLTALLLAASRSSIMGELAIRGGLRATGWITVIIMTVCSAASLVA